MDPSVKYSTITKLPTNSNKIIEMKTVECQRRPFHIFQIDRDGKFKIILWRKDAEDVDEWKFNWNWKGFRHRRRPSSPLMFHIIADTSSSLFIVFARYESLKSDNWKLVTIIIVISSLQSANDVVLFSKITPPNRRHEDESDRWIFWILI